MKTATYIKLDTDVKKQAQKLAGRFGLSLSTMINVQLKQAVRDQRIELSVEFPPEQMTPELEKALAIVEKDIKKNGLKNTSGPFGTAEELDQFFDSL